MVLPASRSPAQCARHIKTIIEFQSVTLIEKNNHATRARDDNDLDLSTKQIYQQPPFFGFVECKPTDSCEFLMFLGGLDDMVAAKFFTTKIMKMGLLPCGQDCLALRLQC
jgi:hypothetical protein